MRREPASRSLSASAPTRLDFGGGWTDVPPYPEERGGFVCNLAIERRATIRISRRGPQDSDEPEQAMALVNAACNAAGVQDVRIDVTNDFPVGSGLGGSSAAGVALAAGLAAWNGRSPHPSELAEASREVEVAGLRIPGGSQDHYAAAYGGALGLTFGSITTVEQIALPAPAALDLEARGLLLYTGQSRISGETITAVIDAYKSRDARVVGALDTMKSLALQMRTALGRGDIDALGAFIGEHWEHQRALHPRISTERIDAIADAAKANGALGMKALGASGGGCVFIVAPQGGRDRIRTAVEAFGEVLEWRIAHTGVLVRG